MTKISYHEWPSCPVYDTFNLLSKRGVMLIIKSISEWNHQFCQIKSSCYNLNNKSLTDKLQDLIESWVVEKQKNTDSCYDSYHLTDRGQGLAQIVQQIVDRGMQDLKQ